MRQEGRIQGEEGRRESVERQEGGREVEREREGRKQEGEKEKMIFRC